jgi:hypothetical protein
MGAKINEEWANPEGGDYTATLLWEFLLKATSSL